MRDVKNSAVLAAIVSLPLGIGAASTPAQAIEGWSEGQPIFRSDVMREQERLEREREQNRSRYRTPYPELMEGGPRPFIAPEAPPVVSLATAEPAGQIIIDSGGRRLFYTLPGNTAYEYPISVGREGFNWTGAEKISRIAAWPDWHPPAEMREREPYLPKKMTGGLNNPLGATALYLGNTLYRIHGTNDAKSIGRAASSGCFRMMNKHVLHLAELAQVGTQVRVVTNYRGVETAGR
ncbi:MAG: L,D-transpeptidase [Rhodomicrobium sp.]|nr:L,D-transpeptidase [Rhodomicrobium sp.]